MTIQAIETRYADCWFRSRLEARWAVFFDRLKIAWEYEAQGFRVGDPFISPRTPYLPDFWLEDLQLWAEVKGDNDLLSVPNIYKAATYRGGLPPLGPYVTDDDASWKERGTPPDLSLILLGPIPRGGNGRACWSMLQSDPASEPRVCHAYFSVLGEVHVTSKKTRDGISVIPATDGVAEDPLVAEAYESARSARFEHGESGAPRAQRRTPAAPWRNSDDHRSPGARVADILGAFFGARTKTRDVPWCGQCHGPFERHVSAEDGRVRRCPTCHPLQPGDVS